MDKARGGFDSLRCALCRIELRKKKSVKLRGRERAQPTENSSQSTLPRLRPNQTSPSSPPLPICFFFGGGMGRTTTKIKMGGKAGRRLRFLPSFV